MKKMIVILFIYLVIIFYSNENYNLDSFIYPTKYTSISSEYGYRILNNIQNLHNGIDFLAPLDSEVIASSSGFISFVGFMENGYGNTVIINHDNNIKTLYCHLSEEFIVHVGKKVKAGDIIGYVGPKFLSNGIQNGNTTGPHLHFTVFDGNNTINPLDILS